MSGINNNRLNEVLSIDAVQSIKALLLQIQNQMPFLVGLSPGERMTLPKINVSNKAFAEDAFNVLRNNPSLFPAFLDVDFLQNDLVLFQQLDELATLSRQLTEKIEDTRTLAGSEAFTTALSIYRIAESASIAGISGSDTIYKQLRDRFIYASTPNTGATPTPEEASPTS